MKDQLVTFRCKLGHTCKQLPLAKDVWCNKVEHETQKVSNLMKRVDLYPTYGLQEAKDG